MEIMESDNNGTKLIRTAGRIDALSAKTLEDSIKRIMADGNRRLVVNLQDTEYVSSGGLRVFLAALKELRKDNGSIRLCCLTPPVLKIFKLAGFTSIFSIYGTEQEALAGCG